MSHREISIRVDQLESKPCSYFPAFLNSQEKQRGKAAEVRRQGSRSVILSLTMAELCVGGITYHGAEIPGPGR
jgi:hypothetical protein